MIDEGRENDLDIDPRLMDEAHRKHYTKLTVEELRGIFDTVENLNTIGRRKQKLVDAKGQRDLKKIAVKLGDIITKRWVADQDCLLQSSNASDDQL